MFRKFSLILVVLFIMCAVLPAQQSLYRYTHYTVEDGLPNQMVYDIVQDRQGFIWLATESGLVKYDGYTFETLTTVDGLPGNDVLRLYLDREDRLWMILYQEGVGYLHNRHFQQLPEEVLPKESFVYTIQQQPNGNMWLGTARRGLFIIDDTVLVNRHYDEVKMDGKLYSSLFTCTDPDGNVWTATYSYYGCCGIEPEKRYPLNEVVPGVHNNHMPIYLGYQFGMGVVSRKALRLITEDGEQQIFPYPGSDDKHDILGVDTLSGGTICVSTKKGAYLVYFDQAGHLQHQDLLVGEEVSGVLEDREGNLWITTLTNGIYFVNTATRKLEALNREVVVTMEFINNRVWAGAKSGKIFVYADSLERELQVIGIGALLTPAVNDILELPQSGRIMFCTDSYVMITDDGNFNVNVEEHFMDTGDFSKMGEIIHDTMGSVLMFVGAAKKIANVGNDVYVSAAHGLYRFYDLDSLFKKAQFVVDGRVLDMCSTSAGTLWLATQKGLRRVDETTISITKDQLGAYITSLKADNYGRLWIGTNGSGLYIAADDTLMHVLLGSSAASNSINDVIPLEQPGSALVATNNGVFYVSVTNGDYSSFPLPINSGLPTRVVNRMLLQDDLLYIATTQGLVRTRYHAEDRDTMIYPLVVKNVLINGIEMPVLEHYELDHDQNNVTFSYAALAFSSERQIQYKYRLHKDANWVETDLTELQLSSLSPGNYVFEVCAKSLNGMWQPVSTGIKLRIKSPYWQTTWFMLLVVGGVVLIVLIVAIAYVRYNRNKDAIARKLVELEGQALRAQMNPHFVFNSLNAVHDFIADSDQRSAHLYLSRFSKLIRKILDNSRRSLVSLAEEIETLKLYIQLEEMRFEGKFHSSIEVDDHVDVVMIKIPPMIIQPYVENAIRHGIMNRNDTGGFLRLRIFTKGNELVCTIEDNGVGRAASAQINQKHDTKHKSYAMEITHERLTQLNTLGKDKGRVEVEDLMDNDGSALGTRVTVRFYLEDGDQ